MTQSFIILNKNSNIENNLIKKDDILNKYILRKERMDEDISIFFTADDVEILNFNNEDSNNKPICYLLLIKNTGTILVKSGHE